MSQIQQYFQKWFAAPVFPGDPEKTRMAALLNTMLLAVAVALFLITVGGVIGNQLREFAFWLLLISSILMLTLRLLVRRGFVRQVSITMIVLVTLGAAAQIAINGSVRLPAASVFFLLSTVMAGLLVGRRAALISTLANCLIFFILVIAEVKGLLPSPNLTIRITQAIAFTVGALLTVVLLNLATRSIDESMTLAHAELAERLRAESEARRLEELYRRAIDAAGAVPYVLGHGTHTFTFVGEGILQMTGYSASEMTSEVWHSMVKEGIPRGGLAHLTFEEADQLTNADPTIPWECDYRILTRDGQTRWIADTSVKGYDEKGERLVAIGIKQDITERKLIEIALRESESRYRGLLENIPVVTYLVAVGQEPLNPTIYVSPQIEKIIGHTSAEFITSPRLWTELIHPDDRAGVIAMSDQADLLGASLVSDYRVLDQNQNIRWIHDENVLVRDEQGHPLHRLGVWTDITARRQAEQAAMQTASQLAVLNEIGRAVTEVVELDRVLEIIRQQLEKMVEFDFYSVRIFNETAQTVTHLAVYENGRYWSEPDAPLKPGTDARHVFETGNSILHLYTEAELEAYRQAPVMQIGDHSQFTASVIFVPLKKQGRTIGALSVQRYQLNAYTEADLKLIEAVAIQVAIAIENARLFTNLQRELADRKRAEALTRQVNFELQRRFKELYALNTIAQAGAAARSEDELLDAYVDTLHRSLYTDIVGIALWDEQAGLLRTHPRANRGLPANISLTTARPHEGVVGEVAATRRSYMVKNINDPQYLAIDPSIRSELCVPILAGDRLVGVLDVESRQPEAFTTADENLLFTIAGQLASALERLRAEQALRNLNAELEQRVIERTAQLEAANKELEAFSYSVSHDLRAPLRGITGFAKILEDDFSGEMMPTARGFLQKIIDSGNKMAQLIDELLDFSRIGRKPLNRQMVDPGDLARAAIDSLAAETVSRQIEWVLAEMPSLNVDRVLFQQVYINLIGNAVKYTGKSETALIEIASLKQTGQVIYFVRDNGAGFDMQYADKLFGVFQRLHREDEFEGTGIGLAIVKRIIERHGGRIWAEAAPGQGATFYFTFERFVES